MTSGEQHRRRRRVDVIGVIAIALVPAFALVSSACALLVETDDLTDSPNSKADAAAPSRPRVPTDAGTSDGTTSSGNPNNPDPDPNPDPGGTTDPGGATGTDASPARDDDAGKDAGPSTPTSGIACGSETCVPGATVCCYAFDAGPVGCATSCAPSQLALPCDDTADCTAAGHAGNFCCITIGPSPDFRATSAQCAATCPATGGTTPFCDNHDNLHTCPKGTSCQVSTLNVPGYHVCK